MGRCGTPANDTDVIRAYHGYKSSFRRNPIWEVWEEWCAVAEAGAFSLDEAVDEESPLGRREQQMLALERQWWKYAGAKEQAIGELFGLSATRYYQILNALIDTEDALAHDPMLVKRLRRLRTSRQRARSARRLGNDA